MLVATPMMTWVRHTAPPLAALETQNPAVGAYEHAKGLEGLKVLDERLSGRDWLAAERITIADIVAFIGLDFARMVRFRPPEELANLGRWVAAMRARPAAKAGMS
jgi:glutathione S-transferase